MKILYIDNCYQCKNCAWDSEWSPDYKGNCMVKDNKVIKDVCKIPEWCPLEVVK